MSRTFEARLVIRFIVVATSCLSVADLSGCNRAPVATTPPPVHPPLLTGGADEVAQLDRLVEILRTRLMLMHDVARAKWTTKAPVTDPVREEALLRQVETKARAAGLDPAWTRAVFAAQIEASKLVQQADFRAWTAAHRGPIADAPNLARDLRPRIDAVGESLIEALAQCRSTLRAPTSRALLRRRADGKLVGPGIDERVRSVATKPLTTGDELGVQRADSNDY
jgi:chorismate mutase